MKFKTKLKIFLPLIISIIRILLIPFIIIFSFKGKFLISIILIIIGFITNIIDNKIASKLYTKTKLSKNIDEVANILFIIGISISFCKINNLLIPISIIEFLNLIICCIVIIKKELTILTLDKINRINIIILCIIIYINTQFSKLDMLINGFSYLTINLTFITLLSYINILILSLKKGNNSIETFEAHKKIMQETDELKEDELMKTKAIKKLGDIIEKYEGQ